MALAERSPVADLVIPVHCSYSKGGSLPRDLPDRRGALVA
jgi:hypothetical protein